MNRLRLFAVFVLLIVLTIPLSIHAVDCTINNLDTCIDIDAVHQHLIEFQQIGDANGDTRYASTNGYVESAEYVYDLLDATGGYNVVYQPFEYFDFRFDTVVLRQIAPLPATYELIDDFYPMQYSASANVTAAVTAVDIQLGLGNTSSSGCEAPDWAGFPVGHIALLQRGTCSFLIKAQNAAASGASGVIIFNQGNTTAPDRNDIFGGDLSVAYTGGIPVVGATYARGEEWYYTPGLTMQLNLDIFTGVVTVNNVIATSVHGNPNNILMLGAHLDSVEAGPGINDNGSGSAALLEVALQVANEPTLNQLRFAWWTAEESGLIGSDFYVASLSGRERNKIKAYLNFDMIASPNYFLGVYDGNGDAFGLAGPPGSAQIEHFFATYLSNQFLVATAPTEISFRSDYAAFFENGIPVGGLFTGAEEIKTPEDVALWGGTAGEQYDPCYHRDCDTIDNISMEALEYNTRAIAASVMYFGNYGAALNGLRGGGNYHALRSNAEASLEDHTHLKDSLILQ